MYDKFLAYFLGTCLILINSTLPTTYHCLSEFIPTLAYTYKQIWQLCMFNTRLLHISQVHSNFMFACTLRVLFSYALPEGYLMALFNLWRTKRNMETNHEQHNSVGIVFVYLLDDKRIVARFPAEARPSPSQRPGLIWCPTSFLLFNACRVPFRIR